MRLALYNVLLEDNEGKIDRAFLRRFFETSCGIAYDDASNSVHAAPENVGFRGDVYNMERAIFKTRHTPYGKKEDLSEVADESLVCGHYEKKTDVKPSTAFILKGCVERSEGTNGTIQHFKNWALIVIGTDGVVSAIHLNDISLCWKHAAGNLITEANTTAWDARQAKELIGNRPSAGIEASPA